MVNCYNSATDYVSIHLEHFLLTNLNYKSCTILCINYYYTRTTLIFDDFCLNFLLTNLNYKSCTILCINYIIHVQH